MKLESIRIKGFRSVEECELSSCGSFNVLIGKNNSGKSNILSAINVFFECLRGGEVATVETSIGRSVDFHDRQTDSPIIITMSFHLSEEERDNLVSDIISEAPQRRNAADSLDTSLYLHVSIRVSPLPRSFAFVSEITASGASRPETDGDQSAPVTILSIDRHAASELREKLARIQTLNRDAENLPEVEWYVDMNYWRGRGDPPSARGARIPTRQALREVARSGLTRDTISLIETLLEESSSHEEFVRSLKTTASRKQEEAMEIQSTPLGSAISTFSGEEQLVPSYISNLLSMVGRTKVLYLTEQRTQIGREEARRLLDLKMRRGGSENLRVIQETVASLLAVEIDAFAGDSATPRGEITAEMDVDNFLVQVNGSGIREALRLILDVEFQHPDILLVEEPEIHLHPAIETSMMRYLKRIGPDCQVFITTHSTNFLDTADMKNVYLVSKRDSSHVQLLDLEEAEAQIPRELGIRLSSLFMYDRLVFVEAPSDEGVLREWASKLRVNLSRPNVGFVCMGGARNLAYFATESTLAFLTRRQVKVWFIIDRDERDDAEIVGLQKKLGQNAVIKALSKRELENYLLCPRAIGEFIKYKRVSSGIVNGEEAIPSDSEIEQAIDDCAEELKDVAIHKRVAKILCQPVYPSRGTITDVSEEIKRMLSDLEDALSKVEEVQKQQTELVEREWASQKLIIIPGDDLIDNVCKKYGTRFRKEAGDGVHIATNMNAEEIDAEMQNIIKDITA